MVTRVLVDANVLYSRTLRDWLFLLQLGSSGGIFSTCYTVDILSEVIANIRKRHPDLPGAVMTKLHDRITETMTERIDAYPPVEQRLVDDPYDRHVHAAAVAGKVDMLLTADRDFLGLSRKAADMLPYEICAPDALFVLVEAVAPETVASVTKEVWEYWRKRAPEVDVVAKLAAAGCGAFAEQVDGHIAHMR